MYEVGSKGQIAVLLVSSVNSYTFYNLFRGIIVTTTRRMTLAEW